MSRKSPTSRPNAEAHARWTIPRGRYRPAKINARMAGDLARVRTPHAA